MATQNKRIQENVERSNRDSLRWAIGLILFFVGIFALASSLFYFGDWEADQSVLRGEGSENPHYDDSVDNPCGYAGAWLAEQFIGRSFGIFGVILPMIVMALGLRIIRRRSLIANHALLSAMMVLLLGSLTLGYIFGAGRTFGSGWGGAYGITLAEALVRVIGRFGTLILLLGGWILTGVFINRNFINTVNSAGNAVVGQGERIVGTLRRRTPRTEAPDTPLDEDEEPEESPLPSGEPQPWKTPGTISEPAAEPVQPVQPVQPAFGEYASAKADEEAEPIELKEERRVNMDQFEEELRRMEHMPPRPSAESPFVEVPRSDEPFANGLPAEGEEENEWEHEEGEAFEIPIAEVPIAEIPIAEVPVREAEAPQPDEVPEQGEAGGIVEIHPGPAEPEGVVVTVEEHEVKVLDEKEMDQTLYDPMKDLVYYTKPSPGLLKDDYPTNSQVTNQEIFENKARIEETLKNFGIPIRKINATPGPTVTLYEIVQAEGVRISKIQGLENDIAQSLKALGIRIIAPIPGRGTIGIEVPNASKLTVSMHSAICSEEFKSMKAELPVVIGRTIQNRNYVFDLARAPHLLVAGATGQGKSVGLNAIITSLLYTKHPSQLKLVMIDPKMVEFSLYAGLEKHFLAKMESEEEAIITDPKKAVYTLHSLEQEMEQRLELCKRAGVRNIVEYNDKFVNRRLPPPKGHRYLPYIVVIIDEFADLIMTAKEVERPVMRLAQKARAIGIHLIIATQRPDVKVITGGIKANFPARIAFRVMQMIDSRTIIDQPGAQQLIGRGDMLFSNNGELTRVQCAFVDTPEVERIVDYISHQQGYPSAYPLPDYTPEGGETGMGSEESGGSGRPAKYDSLFAEIARAAVEQGSISTSMIQRNFEVGFNRAGRIMSQLQAAGIVGPQMGAKPRDILFHDLPSLEAKLQDLGLSGM